MLNTMTRDVGDLHGVDRDLSRRIAPTWRKCASGWRRSRPPFARSTMPPASGCSPPTSSASARSACCSRAATRCRVPVETRVGRDQRVPLRHAPPDLRRQRRHGMARRAVVVPHRPLPARARTTAPAAPPTSCTAATAAGSPSTPTTPSTPPACRRAQSRLESGNSSAIYDSRLFCSARVPSRPAERAAKKRRSPHEGGLLFSVGQRRRSLGVELALAQAPGR